MVGNIFQVEGRTESKVGKHKAIDVTSYMSSSDSSRVRIRSRTRKVNYYEGLDCHAKSLCSWQ